LILICEREISTHNNNHTVSVRRLVICTAAGHNVFMIQHKR